MTNRLPQVIPLCAVAAALFLLSQALLPAVRGGAPPSGSLIVTEVRLRHDFASARDNGIAFLRGVIDDTVGQTLPQDLESGLTLEIADSGDFAASIPLSNCTSRTGAAGTRVRCRSGDGSVIAVFREQFRFALDVYAFRIFARGLSDTQTGSGQPTGPSVDVSLSASLTDQATLCTRFGGALLFCRNSTNAAGFFITRFARLRNDDSSSGDVGSVVLSGLLSDRDTSDGLVTALLDGNASLTVQDSGSFATTISLGGCEGRFGVLNTTVVCSTSDARAIFREKAVRLAENLFTYKVVRRGLDETETGASQPVGPADVTFDQAGLIRSDTVAGCDPFGSNLLLCDDD